MKETLYLGHDVARKKLQKAAERQRKGYQEKCRTVSFKRGDWAWKVDSVFHAGKLHEKNKGPFLIVSQTGPVNYETQEIEGGRKSIVHVDKLYPYVPEDGEVLVSWLPALLTVVEVGCQVEAIPIDTFSKASQANLLASIGQTSSENVASTSNARAEATRDPGNPNFDLDNTLPISLQDDPIHREIGRELRNREPKQRTQSANDASNQTISDLDTYDIIEIDVPTSNTRADLTRDPGNSNFGMEDTLPISQQDDTIPGEIGNILKTPEEKQRTQSANNASNQTDSDWDACVTFKNDTRTSKSATEKTRDPVITNLDMDETLPISPQDDAIDGEIEDILSNHETNPRTQSEINVPIKKKMKTRNASKMHESSHANASTEATTARGNTIPTDKVTGQKGQCVDTNNGTIGQQKTKTQTIPQNAESHTALSDMITATTAKHTGPVLRPRKVNREQQSSVSGPGPHANTSPPMDQPMDMPRAPEQASSRPPRARQLPLRYRRAANKPTVISILTKALVSLAKQSD